MMIPRWVLPSSGGRGAAASGDGVIALQVGKWSKKNLGRERARGHLANRCLPLRSEPGDPERDSSHAPAPQRETGFDARCARSPVADSATAAPSPPAGTVLDSPAHSGQRAFADQWFALRRSPAVPGGDRRSAPSAEWHFHKPQSPLANNWPRRCPRCRPAPLAARWLSPRQAQKSWPIARPTLAPLAFEGG